MNKLMMSKRTALMISVGSAMSATMAVTGLVASGVQAAETVVTPTGGLPIANANVDAHDIIAHIQANINDITASVTSAVVQNTNPDSTVSDTSFTTDANTIKASATGNKSLISPASPTPAPTPSVLLSLTETNGGTDDGIATLAGGFNFGDIQAEVSDNTISADYADVLSGSISVTNDSIGAVANGNAASSTIAGPVPLDFDSAVAGSSSTTANGDLVPTPEDWLNAQGSLVASTLQIQSDALFGPISNEAIADDNHIALNIINTLPNESTVSSPVLDDNTISAAVAGNSSDTTIDIQSGLNPTFAGSAVVTNGQINSSENLADSHITAENHDSTIIATIQADDVPVTGTTDDIQLEGGLSVQGNAITSAASGNQAVGNGVAGNRILIADGMAFAGAGTATPGADIAEDSGAARSSATADLVIHNSQGNAGPDNADRLVIDATTDGAEVGAVVDDVDGASVTVAGNAISAAASGNTATSAFESGEGMPSFTGSAAVASQQVQFYTNVSSDSEGDIYAVVSDGDDIPDSSVVVDGNTVSGTAYGNSVSQSLSLDAVDQNLALTAVTLTGGTEGVTNDGNVHSDGSLTVTNFQAIYDGDVDAREVHNIYADTSEGDAVDGSSVKATNNVAEAISLGNSASNSLALSGTLVGGGAGIASVQINDDADGDDTDLTDGTAYSEGIVQALTNDVDGSSVAVSGNLQRAIAYGGSAGNSLSVTAQTIEADGTVAGTASTVTNIGGVLTGDPQPLVNAEYGVLNVQSLNGDIAATAVGATWAGDTAFLVSTDAVTDSGIVNGGHVIGQDSKGNDIVVGGNTLVAAAYGADATNSADLAVGNLDSSNGDFASVLNLTNVQEVSGRSSVTAQAGNGLLANTVIADDVENSSVATSYNTGQSLAYGNRADNSVAVTSTNINTEADSFPFGIQGEAMVDAGVATTEASFSLNNVQSVSGVVTSSLLDTLSPNTATASLSVLTEIDGDIIDSAISSDGNTLSSASTGNRASNSIGVTGTGLATTVALTNYQIDPTAISSYVGIEGGIQNVMVDPGTPNTIFGYSYTTYYVLNGVCSGGTCPVGSAFDSIDLDTANLTVDEYNYLTGQGWTYNSEENTLEHTRTGITSIPSSDIFGTPGSVSGIELDDGTPPTFDDVYVPGSGGVTVNIHGGIDPSSVTVNDNTVSGSVIGNSATNSASLVGTDVADGSDHFYSYSVIDIDTIQADADVMAVNRQTVSEGGNLNSEVYSTFAVDTDPGELLLDSSVEVDGNKQSSQAIANTADTTVKLGATNTAAGSALASYQDSSAPVSATSGMVVFAPVVSSGSSISMSDNANSALAVQNNANNTLTVDTTNAAYVNDVFPLDADLTVDSTVASAYGDHVLLNEQFSLDSATASASTNIFNDDEADPDTAGLVNGSIDVSGNSTKAQAGGNLSTNIANVSALASLTASAAVVNSQANFGAISADATTDASVTINADDLPLVTAAASGSSITLGNNTTQALAQGNASTNVLNYSAGATYGDGTGNSASSAMDVLALPFSFGETVTAQAAVLNFQGNSGAVTANSTQASYLVALNGADGPNVTNATVNVVGNAVSAAAYGNSATNVVTASALNTDRPTLAIGNYQTNSGPVMASVTTVTYGVTSGLGAITGSSIGVNGNSITATAVGNSATSSIVAGH